MTPEALDFLLTTAMTQAKSEDFSVITVIMAWGGSRTM
jgi:hypothetical protein